MSPEEIKQLRKDLNLTARQLAESIKADTEDVWAWETGERFPTKRFVTKMLSLKKAGAATARAATARAATATPSSGPKASRQPEAADLARLADPALWEVVRKLIGHPELFAKVEQLAQAYQDPAATRSTPRSP